MKRLVSFTLAALFLVFASSCELIGRGREEDDGRVRVVSTFFAPFDFTREIAGDKAALKIGRAHV